MPHKQCRSLTSSTQTPLGQRNEPTLGVRLSELSNAAAKSSRTSFGGSAVLLDLLSGALELLPALLLSPVLLLSPAAPLWPLNSLLRRTTGEPLSSESAAGASRAACTIKRLAPRKHGLTEERGSTEPVAPVPRLTKFKACRCAPLRRCMAACAAKLTVVLSGAVLCVLDTAPTMKLQQNRRQRYQKSPCGLLGLLSFVHSRVAVVDQHVHTSPRTTRGCIGPCQVPHSCRVEAF